MFCGPIRFNANNRKLMKRYKYSKISGNINKLFFRDEALHIYACYCGKQKILLLKAAHTTDAKLSLIRPIVYLLLLLHQSPPLAVIAVVVVQGILGEGLVDKKLLKTNKNFQRSRKIEVPIRIEYFCFKP